MALRLYGVDVLHDVLVVQLLKQVYLALSESSQRAEDRQAQALRHGRKMLQTRAYARCAQYIMLQRAPILVNHAKAVNRGSGWMHETGVEPNDYFGANRSRAAGESIFFRTICAQEFQQGYKLESIRFFGTASGVECCLLHRRHARDLPGAFSCGTSAYSHNFLTRVPRRHV